MANVKVKHPDRMRAAIRVLENLKLPKGAGFNMGAWGVHGVEHEPAEQNFCGTTACAFGWLAMNKGMNKRGLNGRWKLYGFGRELTPTYAGRTEAEAAEAFFGINDVAGRFLFLPSSYPNGGLRTKAADVARRMRLLLKGLDSSALPGWGMSSSL